MAKRSGTLVGLVRSVRSNRNEPVPMPKPKPRRKPPPGKG